MWTVSGATTTDELGASPIAIAKIDGEWGSADTKLSINDWESDIDNSIKIYTTDIAGHNGKWNTDKYRMEAIGSSNYTKAIIIYEDYVDIEGIQISVDGNGYLSPYAAINYSSQKFSVFGIKIPEHP